MGDEWRALQPGMVFTVEPGCYIRPADACRWRCGTLASASKTMLHTELGNEVLVDGAPKTVTDIDELMQ